VSQRASWTAVVIGFALASEAWAAGGTLKTVSRPVLWTSSVSRGVGHVGEVPECASGCDRFDLRIALPNGAWNQKSGGVQVAIRWQGGIFGDNLRLFVYRGSTLVGKSDGIIAISQGVLIPQPVDGLLTVYVAYDPDSTSSPLAYEGLADVEYDVAPHPARPLRPDLEARPQRNLGFDPVGIFFDTISPVFPSCYQSEVDEEGAHLCLRFDQIFANTGEGAMELRFSVPTGTTPPLVDVFQRTYWSDDATRFDERPTGQVEFHGTHGHYHFTSFGVSRLFAETASGAKAALAPIRQRRTGRIVPLTLVRTARKVSFCLADTEIDRWGSKGDGPRTYIAPDCLFPASSDGVHDSYVQGITRGWGDIYDFYLPDQYLEVSGVPDGDYVLETQADPDGLLHEVTRANNCTSIRIRLSGLSTASPSVRLLGSGPACQAQ
jgi:Lysyl oxidase